MTILEELLADLPTLQVFRGGGIHYYTTTSIHQGEMIFVNISDEDDEWYVDIDNLSPTEMEIGRLLNYEEYIFNLEEIIEKQDLLDTITLKRAGLIN